MFKLKNWKEVPIGGVVDQPGSAMENKTGSWRVERPIWNEAKCIHCLRCWVFCPDMSINTVDGKMTGMNYEYCKGCGICAQVCPEKVKAITMQPEEQ
jgi:pyruvate ferredoxin oxidoreductase delta subunit